MVKAILSCLSYLEDSPLIAFLCSPNMPPTKNTKQLNLRNELVIPWGTKAQNRCVRTAFHSEVQQDFENELLVAGS